MTLLNYFTWFEHILECYSSFFTEYMYPFIALLLIAYTIHLILYFIEGKQHV